jgi:hypothetical protein
MPHAYRRPMCTSQDCQWCGEPYFAGAAISIDGFLQQIPKRDKHVITDLVRALWMVNLMLTLNRSLLNREYNLMKVLKALSSIVSICNLRVILYQRLHLDIYTIYKWNVTFIPCKKRIRRYALVRKVDCLSPILIGLKRAAFTPGRHGI